MVSIVVRSIKPARLNDDEVKKQILFALQDEAKQQRDALSKTTSAWQGESPNFESTVDLYSRYGAMALTEPSGSDRTVKKWRYLDSGTSIRWALMSRDWKSKTRPNSVSSVRGAGRVVIFGKRAMQARNIQPRPGIQARNWIHTIQWAREEPFRKRVAVAMRRAAKGLF